MKYTIVTSAYNRPDFIALQLQSLKKWVDDFEYIVYDNSTNGSIKQECERLGVRHVACGLHRRKRASPSQVAALVLNCIARDFVDHTGVLVIIDSDMFLINSLPQMSNNQMAYVEQTRPGGIIYPWTGFMMFDMSALPNKNEISFDIGYGGDTGGAMYEYLTKYRPSFLRLNMWSIIDGVRHSKDGVDIETEHKFEKQMSDMFCGKFSPLNFDVFGVDGCGFQDCFILHYKSASWWSPDVERYHELKTEAFRHFLEDRNKI